MEAVEENRKSKVKEIDRARERRKQTQEKSKRDYSVEITRGDITEVEIKDLEEVIERLDKQENHHIQLSENPQATPHSKAIYKKTLKQLGD